MVPTILGYAQLVYVLFPAFHGIPTKLIKRKAD